MLTPLPPNQWDLTKATHLLNRAGFGGTPAHLDSLLRSGMAASVRYLVDGPATPTPAPAPAWAHPTDYAALRDQMRAALTSATPTAVPAPPATTPGAPAPDADAASRQEIKKQIATKIRRDQTEHLVELNAWWLDRMRQSVDPLEEKMTLFWHGHFATSAQKVKDTYLMYLQNQTFRQHARGNFGVLVKAMSRDPAMIQWLDLRESKAAHPNENFAREVMELFTLGEGHYTEKDVTEGARAFTGYRIDPRDATFRFVPRDHDNLPKTVLGRNDLRDGDQVIETILAQPACAHYLAAKLWTFFVNENPPAPLVDALAASLRTHNYEMRPVLHQLFTSQEFYDPAVVRTQIKSPVQWMVQTARTLEVELPPRGPLIVALRQMGQVPFNPPSVKGWDGGKAWISTSTLLTRYNLSGALLRVPPASGPAAAPRAAADRQGPDAAAMPGMNELYAVPPAPPIAANQVDYQKLAPAELRADPAALVHTLALRLYQNPPPPKDEATFTDYLKSQGPRLTDAHIAGLLHLMMSTPYFQLC